MIPPFNENILNLMNQPGRNPLSTPAAPAYPHPMGRMFGPTNDAMQQHMLEEMKRQKQEQMFKAIEEKILDEHARQLQEQNTQWGTPDQGDPRLSGFARGGMNLPSYDSVPQTTSIPKGMQPEQPSPQQPQPPFSWEELMKQFKPQDYAGSAD